MTIPQRFLSNWADYTMDDKTNGVKLMLHTAAQGTAILALLCDYFFWWPFQGELQHCKTVYFLDPFDSWMANKASPIHVLMVELIVETHAY